MNRLFRKMDKPLFFTTFIMFVFGLIMIFSASYVRASVVANNPYQYFTRQAIILFICLIAFFIIINIPTKLYKKYSYLALYGIIALLLGLIFFGTTVNYAQSWYDLGPFNLQPSELAKIALIIFLGVYYEKHIKTKNELLLFRPFLYFIVILFLTFIQPDFGTALIISAIFFTTFLSIPIENKTKNKIYKILFLGVMLLGIVILINSINGKPFFNKTQMARFDFLEPCNRYTEAGTGYQVCNGYIAINNGGLFGVGVGNSTQKYLYLPESHTDFIFPIIMEELGLLISIFIFIIYMYIIFRIIKVSKNAPNLSGSIICYGVAMYLFAHIFLNFVGFLGLLPLTGVPLPFLSYGGSYALTLTVSLAIVQRIAIEGKSKSQEQTIQRQIRGRSI